MTLDNGIGPLLTNSFGDQYFHGVNGSAFNQIGSASLYSEHYADRLLQENTLYIVLGTDSGLLPKYLQKNGLPAGARYIFVELDEVLERLGEVMPEGGFDSRIILTPLEMWVTHANEIGLENYILLGRMKSVHSIGAKEFCMEGYQECSKKLWEELGILKWTIREKLSIAPYNVRRLENLAENRLSAIVLKDSFKGKTAVILGGGPSLDTMLPWIAENRECLVVIAISRLARRMIEVDLIPDIFVSIDPQQISFDISKEMLLLGEESLFAHQYHVSNRLLGQWRGRNLFLGPRFGWPTPLNADQLTGSGPTVTNTAIDLGIQMGFSRLLLAGVDLCFSKEGFTHALGSNEREAGSQLGRGGFWVETNSGGFAETTPDLNQAINIIENQAETAKEKGCQIYNLWENSAKIPGVEFSKPADIMLEPLTEPAHKKFKKIIPEETALIRETYIKDMMAELDRASTAFEEIKHLSEDAINANDYFSGRRGHAKGRPKYRKQIDNIEKKLNTNFRGFTVFLKEFGIKNFLEVAHSRQDKKLDAKNTSYLMQRYYETYRDTAKQLLDVIHAAKDRLYSRREEEKEFPDFNLMIEQWEKDQQPGRALVWKTRHGADRVPKPFLPKFEALERTFSTVIKETETMHMAMIRNRMKPGILLGRLKKFFKHGEKERLEYLLTGMQSLADRNAAILFQLGSGFLSELSGHVDAAMQSYQNVIEQLIEEQGNPILENALIRVFTISLDRQDLENCLLASKCLADISPAHLPYYAEVLRLTGDKIGALEVYTDYLEKVKTDIRVMLKMGRLYLELGVLDGAKLMCESVLKENPENQAALKLLSTLDGK